MPYKRQQKNRPVASLLKLYLDKKSGKVTDARQEIQRRFDYLDWRVQKKILLAFLQACKSDREWAYMKVYRLWDDCFTAPLRTLWEQYHENLCAWSVIEHFPMEYVKENMALLEEANGYYHLCLRLAADPSYTVERSRLSGKEYLLVMLHTHREVAEEEARDIFFNYLHKFCLTDPESLYMIQHKPRGYPFGVEDIRFMNSVLWLFHLLGLDTLRESIRKWDNEVMQAIDRGDEMKSLNKEAVDDDEYNKRRMAIGLDYLYRALDEKYKQPADKSPVVRQSRKEAAAALEEMRLGNPAVEQLISSFALTDASRYNFF